MSTAAAEAEIKVAALRLAVKAVNTQERTFEGLAATWDLDLGGDIIEKGAFAKTIKEWKRTGRVLPLLDSHNWFSVRDAVGKLIDAKETDEGLWTKWKIVPGADGDEILARLKADEDGTGFIDSMSIGYRPVRWEMQEEEDDFTRILKEVELHEVSLVLFPMNPAARIDSSSVKQMATTVRMLVERVPLQLRRDLKSALQKEVSDIKIEEPPKDQAPVQDPPAAKDEKKDPPRPRGSATEEEEPDFSKFDQLRLRRLAHSRTTTPNR